MKPPENLKKVHMPVPNSELHVAVVDGYMEGGLAEIIALGLSALGFKTRAFSSAAAFATALNEQPFAAAVLEWEIDGAPEGILVEMIRAHQPNCPVLLLTAHQADLPPLQEASQWPLTAHLVKPVSLNDVNAMIGTLIESSRSSAF